MDETRVEPTRERRQAAARPAGQGRASSGAGGQERPRRRRQASGDGRTRTTQAQQQRGSASGGGHGIWTPANIVTVARIVLIPLWLLAAEAAPASDGSGFALLAFLVALFYIALALTDKLDGYLARSRGEVTTFGKFLDPIADKLVVLVALCFLNEQHLVSSWVLLVVLAREFLVSGLRMVVASKGVVVAASNLGKWKTAVTMVAICVLLVVRSLPEGWFFRALSSIGWVGLIAAVGLTAWSGIDYFVKCREYLLED